MNRDGLLKAHCRYHAGVADGLQFHVAAVIGSLEFNDNQICLWINCEQIDTTPAVIPVAKFLRQHIEFITQHIYLRT